MFDFAVFTNGLGHCSISQVLNMVWDIDVPFRRFECLVWDIAVPFRMLEPMVWNIGVPYCRVEPMVWNIDNPHRGFETYGSGHCWSTSED